MEPIQTAYGPTTLAELIRVYEQVKRQNQEHYERRKDYLSTEEGKEWNREHARRYYEAHREAILAKRALKRQQNQTST